MTNSGTQNAVQNRQRYSKSHEMKQRDRTDKDKEKNDLSRLVLIMVSSRERSGQACAKATLLDAAKEDMRWP